MASGKLTGWIYISQQEQENQGVPAAQISLNEDGGNSFTTRVRPIPVTLGYLLSVIGSVIGTLLVSLPAWLAWYDKRKDENAKRGNIVIVG